MKTKRSLILLVTSILILATLLSFVQVNTRAQGLLLGSSAPRFLNSVCYLVADNQDGQDEDTITWIDWDTQVQTVIGNTGTYNVETIAFEDDTQTLYGIDQDVLGTFDLDTGKFIPKPNHVGDGIGIQNGVQTSETFGDIDGMAFDKSSGMLKLYATVRRGGKGMNDLLVQINPETGERVQNAFGTGQDYVVIQATAGFYDIDDIAIDPVTKVMWGIANNSGAGDHLTKINMTDGSTTDVGPVGVNDMEGLSFDPVGQLLGTSGKAPNNIVNGQDMANHLFRIDNHTGAADTSTTRSIAIAGTFDYEAVDCLNAPVGVTPTPTFTPVVTDTPPVVTETPTPTQPTAVTLLYFRLDNIAGDKFTLKWETASETDNAGFNLYRSNTPDPTKAVRINKQLIPSKGHGVYSYTDMPGQGVYWYWLADVSTKAGETPASKRPVVAVGGNQVFVPFIRLDRP